jgi:AsmA protein
LRQLYLDGRINVGKFRFSGARLSDVLVTISARNGQIRMNPLTANLYSGSYSGDMRLDVTGEQPKLSVNEKLSGVQIGALLADASKVRNLDGISEARVTATAAGNSVNELLANLAGDASLDIQKGVFRGVDLWYEIRKARALLKREAPPSAPKDPFTDISKLTGTAKFANGSIANNDFQAQASYLGINGKGTVNLLESTLDYRLDAKVVGTPTFDDGKKLGDMNGMVLPVTIKGKLASPSVKVDVGAMAVDVGKRKLLDRLEKKLGVEKPAAPADASSGAPAGSADGSGAAAADAEPDQQAPQQQESKPEDPKEQLKKSLLKMLGN